ncbi:hypothetical protein K474DRAFT_1131340 [Panus rudis PR-1116 ss-1]|nr:hypothetical protein K474DRAFT_1131340 [Panus rudis PR-1116 ss-1]
MSSAKSGGLVNVFSTTMVSGTCGRLITWLCSSSFYVVRSAQVLFVRVILLGVRSMLYGIISVIGLNLPCIACQTSHYIRDIWQRHVLILGVLQRKRRLNVERTLVPVHWGRRRLGVLGLGIDPHTTNYSPTSLSERFGSTENEGPITLQMHDTRSYSIYRVP